MLNSALIQTTRKKLLEQQQFLLDQETGPKSFRYFVQAAWPLLIPGRSISWNWHLEHYCELAEALVRFEIRDLGLCVPPRSSKSTIFSVLLPVWAWLTYPHLQFLTLSHKEDIAVRDAVASRHLIRAPWFQERYGSKFQLVGDQDEKHKYRNNHSGQRVAQGLLAGITGEGGDIQIIDDPHDAQKAQSVVEQQRVIDAFENKLPTRFNDFSKCSRIIIMQRLHSNDAIGWMKQKYGDSFQVVSIPMRYTGRKVICNSPYLEDPREELGEALDTTRFSEKIITRLEKDLGSWGASAQLQQEPTPKGGGILQSDWWRKWNSEELPAFDFTILAVDGAFTEKEVGASKDFDPKRSQSAWTFWGAFKQDGYNRIMLVKSWADWVDFYDFKRKVFQITREKDPDIILIESAASGKSLIQELKRGNIPVHAEKPNQSKVARAYMCQTVLETGMVFYVDSRENHETIHQCAVFPKGQLDDRVDTVTMALNKFKRMRFADLKEDLDVEEAESIPNPTPTPLAFW